MIHDVPGGFDELWADNPLVRLEQLGYARDYLRLLTEQAASECRNEGLSWQRIGNALRISRAAAWERFHD